MRGSPTRSTVLLVDDNALVRDAVQRTLEARGFAVTVASDGESAIQLYVDTAIDAVLVDMDMPGIDGLETCRRLRSVSDERGQPFCAWLITGVVRPGLEMAARAAGAHGVLPKPFTTVELSAHLAQLSSFADQPLNAV